MFQNRLEAGRLLASAVRDTADTTGVLAVYGIPRGGVLVAREVANILGCPLDVVVTRKIGSPSNEELAIGAIAEDGVVVLDESLIERLKITSGIVAHIAAREKQELERRLAVYRGPRTAAGVEGVTAVVVDDGIATGATVKAALAALRRRGAARTILAVPVASADGLALAAEEADEVVCLITPAEFFAVGQWYEEFHQASDDEVVAALAG